MPEEPFEAMESADGLARWYFSHSDKNVTTGLLILQPGAKLPKHQRPVSYESSVQISGKSRVMILKSDSEVDIERTVMLSPGEQIRLEKGHWHIHSNPFEEVSITLFKHIGDMTKAMQETREHLKQRLIIDK
jgi:quercetin dioxygenase-like cupin family protein